MRGLYGAGTADHLDGRASAYPRRLSDPADALTCLVAVFVGASVLSTACSTHPIQSLIRGAWASVILAGCLFYALTPNRFAPHVRKVLTGFLIVLCAASLWQVWTGYHLEAGRIWRAHGWLPHPNDTALAAVIAPLLSPWMWPFAAGLILLSGSRTALVGLAVSVLMLTRSWRLRALVIVAAGVGLVAFVHAASVQAITSRVGAWAVAWRMFREHPWIGMGPQTFVDHYVAWLPAALPFGIEPTLMFMPWAHNLYLEVLAERGLLGLAVLAAATTIAWRSGPRPIKAALAALLVMGLVDLTFLKPWVVGAYWGLVTLTVTDRLPSTG